LLWRLGARSGAWLYALSPLVVKEISFTAHPDGLVSLLLLAAVAARVEGRCGMAGAWLGLAIGGKVFAAALAPFILWRARPRAAIASVAVLALLYAPFLGQGADFRSLFTFAARWEFNPALFALFRLALPDGVARAAAGAAYLLLLLQLWRLHTKDVKGSSPPRGDWVLGGLLLFSPVINPWYLLWILPFAALFPSRAAWTASLLLLLAYAHPLGRYDLPVWVSVAEFLPIAVALVFDLLQPGPAQPADAPIRQRFANT
jgi:hypothetical protein